MSCRLLGLLVLLAAACWCDSLVDALKSHRFQDVVDQSAELVKQRPNDVEVWTVRGVALEALDRDAESLVSFNRALHLKPDSVPALKGAIEVGFRLHDSGTGLLLERLIRIQPANPVAHAMAGTLAFEAKDYASAIKHFAKGGEQVAGNERAYAQYGASLIAVHRASEAIPVFRQLVTPHPNDRNARFNLGNAQLLAGMADDAVETLLPFDLGSGSNGEELNLLASAEAAAGHLDKAAAHLTEAIKIDPAAEQNYVDLAAMYVRSGALAQASTAVTIGLTKLPASARLHSLKGVVRAQLGTFEEASAEFELANQLDPREEPGAAGLGVLYTEANQAKTAVTVLREHLAKTPDNPTLNYLLADALLHANTEGGAPDVTEARRRLTTALRTKPDFAKAHMLLGKLYNRTGDYLKASKELRLAVAYGPNDRTALSQLAIALRHLGRESEAAVVVANLRQLILAESFSESGSTTRSPSSAALSPHP